MTTNLVVLWVCVVAIFIISVMKRLGNRWNKPHFRWNKVGGVLAICSSSDHTKASKSKLCFPRGNKSLTVVQETLVFSDNEGALKHRFSGKLDRYHPDFPDDRNDLFLKRQGAKDLFVPFASEKYLPFSTQEALFMPEPANLETFAERKVGENYRADVLLRFSDWILSPEVYGWFSAVQTFAFVAGVLSLWLCLGTLAHRANEAAANERVTIYVTSPGEATAQEIIMTGEEADRSPLGELYPWMRIVRKGRLVSQTALGGGLRLACVQGTGKLAWYGFADSSRTLVNGEVVHLRFGSLLMRQDNKNKINTLRENSLWVITETEALALKDKGFSIITD